MSATKILYVEDEVFLGKIVRESLESRGFEVVMESDGAKVLELFKKSNPDICVLDVMLPNIDGFELGREIRTRFDQLPIIFLTGYPDIRTTVRAIKAGGEDFLVKPIFIGPASSIR